MKVLKHKPALSIAPPHKVTPIVHLRESSISSLAAHGVIDADQVVAAFHFRSAWERYADLHNPRQFAERVDYQMSATRAAELRDTARKEMQRYRLLLGEHGFALVMKVCGEGYHIRDLYASRRERDTMTDILRIHLTAMAAIDRAHVRG